MPDDHLPRVLPAATMSPPVVQISAASEAREVADRYFSQVFGDMGGFAEMKPAEFREYLEDLLFVPPPRRHQRPAEEVAVHQAVRRWLAENFGDDFKALLIAGEALHARILAALETA